MQYFIYCPMCKGNLEWRQLDGKKRLQCIECNWINYINPVPAVACLARDGQGRVLLVKRAVEPEKGKWSVPAGFMELEETSGEAVLRELKEETGLTGSINRLIGVYTQGSSNYGAVLSIGYLVDIEGGELEAGDDSEAAEFRRINNIEEIPFESHRQMLKDAVKE